MSTTGVHLVGPKGTISTSQYPKQMPYHANAAPLRSYILSKNHWSPHIFDSVHWEAHGAASKKANKKRIYYTKLVFNLLLTHSRANKYDRGTRKCPNCDHSSENRDHILRCASPSAVKWCDEFLLELNEFCRRTPSTPPELKKLMIDALTQWFGSDDEIQLDPAAYSESLQSLILEQNGIGWRQIFSGPALDPRQIFRLHPAAVAVTGTATGTVKAEPYYDVWISTAVIGKRHMRVSNSTREFVSQNGISGLILQSGLDRQQHNMGHHVLQFTLCCVVTIGLLDHLHLNRQYLNGSWFTDIHCSLRYYQCKVIQVHRVLQMVTI